MYLRKAIRGTVIVFIFTVLAGVMWYLFRFLLARNLSLEEYGVFYAIFSFLSFIAITGELGLSQAVPKFIIDFNVKNKKKEIKSVLYFVFFFQVVVLLLVFIAVMLLSGWLSENYFHYDVSKYLLLMGLWFITLPLPSFLSFVFLGFQRYANASSIDFVRVVALTIAVAILFSLGFGIYSVLIAYALINVFLLLFFSPFARKTLSCIKGAKFVLMRETYVEVIKYGFFLSITSLVWVILNQIDTMMLTYFKGLEAVGLYQIAVPLASIAMYVISAVVMVAYPMSAELYAKKKMMELKEGIKMFYKYLFLILVPFVMVLFSFASVIILFLFGSKYVDATPALKILSIGVVFSSLTLFNINLLNVMDEHKKVARLMVAIASVNVILNLFLIPIFGIKGAAFSTVSSFFISAAVSLILLHRKLGVKIPFLNWIKIIILGILSTLIIYYLKKAITMNDRFEFLIIAAVVGMFYIGGCFVLRIVSLKEIKYIFENAIGKNK